MALSEQPLYSYQKIFREISYILQTVRMIVNQNPVLFWIDLLSQFLGEISIFVSLH